MIAVEQLLSVLSMTYTPPITMAMLLNSSLLTTDAARCYIVLCLLSSPIMLPLFRLFACSLPFHFLLFSDLFPSYTPLLEPASVDSVAPFLLVPNKTCLRFCLTSYREYNQSTCIYNYLLYNFAVCDGRQLQERAKTKCPNWSVELNWTDYWVHVPLPRGFDTDAP